jgi:hypothetical protein
MGSPDGMIGKKNAPKRGGRKHKAINVQCHTYTIQNMKWRIQQKVGGGGTSQMRIGIKSA